MSQEEAFGGYLPKGSVVQVERFVCIRAMPIKASDPGFMNERGIPLQGLKTPSVFARKH